MRIQCSATVPRDLRDWAARIELKGFPLRFQMLIDLDGYRDEVRFLATARVFDRETQLPITIHMQNTYIWEMLYECGYDYFEEIVFGTLRAFLEHELRECFYADGKRVRDPHPNKGVDG